MTKTQEILTALLIGFLLGMAAMCGLFVTVSRWPPPTPELGSPTAIKVTLYPWYGVGGIDGEPVEIPPDKLGQVFRMLTPQKYFGDVVYEFVTPVIAEAVVTQVDGKRTSMLIRDHGHNPAVVTVDGQHYFYARNDPDVHAGAIELIKVVRQVANQKKAQTQPKK